MEYYLEQLNLAGMMEELDQFFPDSSWDLSGLFSQILSGNFKDAGIAVWQNLTGGFGAQLAGMKGLMVSLLLLGMLSMILSGFTMSFENHQISDIAHYIFYLMLLAVLLKIFSESFGIAKQVLSAMAQFSRMVLPALCLSLGPAAGSVTAAGYYELALFLIFLVENLLLGLCLPLLPAFMLLLLMNGVWEEGRLGMLMELLEKGILAAIRFFMAAVTGISVLQSMVAPALDSIRRSAAQKAVSAIPALGGLAESTTQLLVGSAVLVKNSLGVFCLILLAILVAVPFGKMLAYGILLKVCSALMGIVADKRLTACVNRTADAVFLALKLCACGAACFIILIAIVTCLVGK